MKQNISMIAAVAKNRVIGLNNQLPWNLPADLAYFKRQTKTKPIIMGRKTFLSIGRPLPQRRNIVLTRATDFSADGIEVCHSLQQAFDLCQAEPEVMVIGGGHVYEQAIAFANKLYLTIVDSAPEGDAFFPDWQDGTWHKVAEQKFSADKSNDHDYTFTEWQRIST
jgi:dihydrofolate reductase